MSEDRRHRTLEANGLRFSALDAGEQNQSVVLCLHGFPDSPQTFAPQIGPFVDAGHRVIVPTLRGYEPSSQPANGDYSLTTLADDVAGWLDHLDLPDVHLVGHDWGAAIAYTAAAKHPNRFRTVSALAVPPLPRIPSALLRVPKQLLLSWYMSFFQLRRVAEKAVSNRDWWLLRRLWRSWSPDYAMTESHWAALRSQFEQPGVLSASLAYYRQNATPPILLGLQRTEAMVLREVSVPTLVMHGERDGCMSRRLFAHTVRTEDFTAGVERIEVPGAGHFLHLERSAAVNTALLRHFNANR